MPGGALMTPTRLRTLFLLPAVLAVASWLLLQSVYTSLPSFPWTMVPALIIAAGGEAITARGLRARILGRPGTKPVPPLQVARMVALAKASSLASAGIGGVAGRVAAGAGGRPRRAARQPHLRRVGAAGRGRALPGVLLPGPGRPGLRPLHPAAPAPGGPLPPVTPGNRTENGRTWTLKQASTRPG